MSKLSKSQFVHKMRHDLSRFDKAMNERQKEVMLKDYESRMPKWLETNL